MFTGIHKGDGIILWNDSRGIAITKPFKPQSMDIDGLAVAVSFDMGDYKLEMPIELRSITEVWREGKRVDNQEQIEQLSLGI